MGVMDRALETAPISKDESRLRILMAMGLFEGGLSERRPGK